MGRTEKELLNMAAAGFLEWRGEGKRVRIRPAIVSVLAVREKGAAS